MTVRVGVIGVGMIGQDHIRRLTTVLSGAAVVGVSDIDRARAEATANCIEARVYATAQDVIEDSNVDAILIASWGATHEQHLLPCIAAGKPVFCEKPLSDTQDSCLRILDAELAFGRRLIQLGFMRRYDPAYRALKDAIRSGAIGAPIFVHCAHRNATAPAHFTNDMVITDSAVHEIDIVRWLLDDEIAAVSVLAPARKTSATVNPLFVILEMASGALVDVELSINGVYGYDIRGEVVGEIGTAALAESNPIVVKQTGAFSGRISADWRERFLRAYDIELQEWLDSVANGTTTGPSTWDGYAATATAEAALQSLHTGTRAAIPLRNRPALYQSQKADPSARILQEKPR
jgi:myo-inositol 2-dehydrogenase / D-chiro-inositol 1-dehydrogenase